MCQTCTKEYESRLKAFLDEQCNEILKFKWCLGVELHHDPLLDMTMNEICILWISKYAALFRAEWERKNGKL